MMRTPRRVRTKRSARMTRKLLDSFVLEIESAR